MLHLYQFNDGYAVKRESGHIGGHATLPLTIQGLREELAGVAEWFRQVVPEADVDVIVGAAQTVVGELRHLREELAAAQRELELHLGRHPRRRAKEER